MLREVFPVSKIDRKELTKYKFFQIEKMRFLKSKIHSVTEAGSA